MQIVHTARLRLLDGDDEKPSGLSSAAVGQVVRADLTIRHTRKWGIYGSFTDIHDRALDFYYEIHANPDMWLIGGQKKAHFTAKVS